MQRTYADAIIWLLDELCLVRATLVTRCDASELGFYKEKLISHICETHWKYEFRTIASKRVTMEKNIIKLKTKKKLYLINSDHCEQHPN